MSLESGKLDDLSVKIGEIMEGQRALSQYTHQHAHDMAGLSGKVDGVGHQIGKRIEELENRVNLRIENMATQLRAEATGQIASLTTQLSSANVKIAILENAEIRRQGALSVGGWLLKSPFLGWIAALAAVAAGLFARDHGL